jgi:hypothetical protein
MDRLQYAQGVAAVIEVEHDFGYTPPPIHKAKHLESQGWKQWLLTLFPFWFSEEFSEEHVTYWELHWSVLQRIKAGEIVPNKQLVKCLLLGRGLGKSSVIEAARIMRGAILGRGYSLIVSETDDQAQEHLGNCRILIEHPDSRLLEFYPTMAVTENADALKGMPTADRKEMFICKNGYILRAKGLSAKMRGLRVGIHRPDDIALDDIDDVNDSLAVSASKLRLITASILPVQARENVTIDVGQNLISEHSVVNQIYTGKTDALADRTIIGVANAFTELEIESKIDDTGKMRHVIQEGSKPSWSGFNVLRAQKFLDNSGLATFYAEYQNRFDQFKSGRVISNYNEEAQLITWSQFAAVFGTRRIPAHWKALCGLDVGYSDGQYPHYSAWSFIATAAQNSPLPNSLFLYRGRSFVGVSIDDQANIIKSELYPEERQMVQNWLMSHEKSGEMLTLTQKHKLPFGKFPYFGVEDGVAQWKHLSMRDQSKPNPFKDDKSIDGKYRIGRSQLYYIVDDNQERLALDDGGLRLLREQVSTWEYVPVKLTEQGQTVQKPSKVNDDFCDSIKGILAYFGARATRLTAQEQIERQLEQAIPEARIQEQQDPMSAAMEMTRKMHLERELRERITDKPAAPAWATIG